MCREKIRVFLKKQHSDNLYMSITPTHFTYTRFEDKDDLFQGDIIESNEEIHAVLDEIFPYFSKQKYNAFMIITQTCDLVRGRRHNPCKSLYINLAIIRSIEDILYVLLDRVCEKVEIGNTRIPNVYTKETKHKAKQLLERIINQNEQDLGIFYLYPDVAIKMASHSIAFLQINFALRADMHYEKLVNARTGRLSPEFRSKLGWLTGNLYSRIGTKDLPNADKREIIEGFLNTGAFIAESPKWISKADVDFAKKYINERQLCGLSQRAILDLVSKYQPEPTKKVAIKRILAILEDITETQVFDTIKDNIQERLNSDPVFETLLAKR